MSVRLTVTFDCGHAVRYIDVIEEKYPFYCGECHREVGRGSDSSKYPWAISTEVIDAEAANER